MMKTTHMLRASSAAIAASLALSSTLVQAQEAAPDPLAAQTPAPATEAAPAPVADPAPAEATPAVETPAAAPSEPAPTAATKTVKPKGAPKSIRSAAAPAPAANPEPAAPVTADAPTPVPEPVAETAMLSQPVAPPPPEPTAEPILDDGSAQAAFGGALALLLLGGATAVVVRRRRRQDDDADDLRVDGVEAPVAGPEPAPAAPLNHWSTTIADRSAFAWGAAATPLAAPAAQPAQGGSWTERARQGPTPDNPSLSLKKRLKRAAFYEQREREIAAGEAQPIAPLAGLPTRAVEAASAPAQPMRARQLELA